MENIGRARATRGERKKFAYDYEGATRLSIKCILPGNNRRLSYSTCSKLCTDCLIVSIACLFVEKLIF